MLCLDLSELLLALVCSSCLDSSLKERQSITGYVYKALWNGAMTYKNEDELVLKLRLRSIQLALVGTCVDKPSKISQQLNVTLSDGSKVTPGSQELSRLYQCAETALKRSGDSEIWKSLVFYAYCVLSVQGQDLTSVEVCKSL